MRTQFTDKSEELKFHLMKEDDDWAIPYELKEMEREIQKAIDNFFKASPTKESDHEFTEEIPEALCF